MQDLTQIKYIETETELSALYGAVHPLSLDKVVDHITPKYEEWIKASRFCVLATYANNRVDISPRGDDGPVVHILDRHHIAIPDWRGNNRLDSLRNIVQDGAVSVLFMSQGSHIAIRVIGKAKITADDNLCDRFERDAQCPKTVIVVRVEQIYAQCGRAILRAGLWSDKIPSPDLPTMGDFLQEAKNGHFDGPTYDSDWAERAQSTLWSDK